MITSLENIDFKTILISLCVYDSHYHSLGSRLKRLKIVDSEFRVVVVAFKQIFCSKKKNKTKQKQKTKLEAVPFLRARGKLGAEFDNDVIT